MNKHQKSCKCQNLRRTMPKINNIYLNGLNELLAGNQDLYPLFPETENPFSLSQYKV